MNTYPAPKASIERTAARRFADSATHSAFAPLELPAFEEYDEMLRERADAEGTRYGFDAPSGGRL